MRIKASFTLFPRKMASGKVIYYYQCYDENGERITAHSTGESLKTLAKKKCDQLLKEGLLIPAQRKKIMTFAEFAKGWWDWDTCKYLQKKKNWKGLKQETIETYKRHLRNWILPFFGKKRLDRITEEDCEMFLTGLPDQETKRRKGNAGGVLAPGAAKKLKTSTANVIFGVFRLMMKQAVKEHLIPFNPGDAVEELTAEGKVVDILSPAEAKQMFAPEVKSNVPLLAGPEQEQREKWELRKFAFAHELAQFANMVAAISGMRIGEVLGLKGSCVYDTYIRVAAQYTVKGEYRETKTKNVRLVPTTPIIIDQLNKLKTLNGNEFLFSDDSGATPITRYMFNQALSSGLSKIGIDETEKKQRNLTPHAWRHFFNTTLRANNVSDAKAQSIIGHATQSMTEHYTHFDTLAFAEVKDIQDNILLQEPVKQADRWADEAPNGNDTGETARRPDRARRYISAGRHETRRALMVQRKKHRHG
ncbi:hypothetical protein AGMMS49546_08440 [Spirochaetia bacterium]|nr:hypothetical protein AGMMS49546_08440 [Spirochaetia bacterium]